MSPTLQDTIVQDDFSSGMVRDVAPHLIPQDGVRDVTNGLLNEDGSIYRRGGSVYKSATAFGSTGMRFLWEGFMDPGRRTVYANTVDFGVLDADDTTSRNLGSTGCTLPPTFAYLKGYLFIGGGHIYGGSRLTANYSTGTITTTGTTTVTGSGTTWTTNVDAGMLIQFVANGEVFRVKSVTSNTVLILDRAPPTYGPGHAYTAYRIYDIQGGDPYEVADVYQTSQNRLVWRADDDASSFRFSEINNPHSWTNQFGTVNEHSLPDGVTVTGMCAVGALTLIFTNAGAWTLAGLALDIVDIEGSPQHRLQPLSRDYVLWGQAGVAYWEQLAVVPCTQGIYLMDGSSRPILISQNVTPLLQFYSSRSYYVGQAQVFKNHYILPILDAGGLVRDTLVCRLSRLALDRRRRGSFAWSRFSGHGGQMAAYAVRAGDLSTARLPGLLGADSNLVGGGGRVEDCSAFFTPTAAFKKDGDGSTHTMNVETRDFGTGNGTVNVVRSIRWRYELSDAATDDPRLIASWGFGHSSGLANWDEVNWDAFNWDATTNSYQDLTPHLTEDNGEHPVRNRIRDDGRVRFARFNLRSFRPSSSCVLRSLEINIRPSLAVRR